LDFNSSESTASIALDLDGVGVPGDTWRMDLNGTLYTYAVVSDTIALSDIASELAAAINGAATTFTATARRDIVVVINDASFTISPSVTPADSFVLNLVAAPATSLLTLNRAPIGGQSWTATVGGVGYTHPVTEGQTRSDIAAALAVLINADNTDGTPTGFVAGSDGDVLIIVKELGTTPFTSGVVASAASTANVDASPSTGSSAAAEVATLTGTVNPGEFWKVTIDGRTYTAEGGAVLAEDEFGNVTDTVDSIAEVAGILADNINADNWSAVITLDGSVGAGEDWTVTVGGTPFTVTTDSTLSSLAKIAEALAADILAAATSAAANDDVSDDSLIDYKAEADGAVLSVGTLSGQFVSVSFTTSAAAGTFSTVVPFNYTAIAEGDSLVIVNRAGDSFTPVFGVVPSGAGAVDSTTPASAIVDLSGTPIVAETWFVVLTTSGQIHAFSHTVSDSGSAIDTLVEIAASLASQINTAALPGFVATTEGDTLIIVSRDGQAFTTASEITHADGTPAGALLIDDSTATGVLASLSGTQAEGEVWSVLLTVGDQSVQAGHTVSDSDGAIDTLAEIAAALAEEINATELDDFFATTEGNTLIIVSLTGADFTAQTAIEPTRRPAGLGVVTAINNPIPETTDFTTQAVSLGGTIRIDQVWSLTLTVDDVPRVFTYTADGSDTLSDIAAALAGELNTGAEAGFAASTEGETIYITDRFARSFGVDVEVRQPMFALIDSSTAVTTTVQLSGDPGAGEVWFLTIDDLFFKVIVNATPQSLAGIAAIFADLINASVDADEFTAWTEGETIIIVNTVGEAFETTTQAQSVTRSAGEAFTTLEYDLSAEDVQERLQILYGFDDIVVEKQSGQGNVIYTVIFVREEAGKNKEEIQWAETRLDTGLLPSPGASAEVLIDTIRDGSTDAGLNNVQTVEIDAIDGTFTLSFILESEEGEPVLVTTEEIAYNASALDMFKALSRLLNPDGATIDIDEDFDRETRDPSRPYTDNVAVSKHDNVFQITFQGAYADLSIYDIDTSQLVGDARSATITFTGLTDGNALIGPVTATTTTIALTGTPKENDIWTVSLTIGGNTTAFHHVVYAENADAVALALAAQINARAGAGFKATTDGATLVIINVTGTDFQTSFGVTTISGDGQGTVDPTTATTTTVDLSGDLVAGEFWRIVINGDAATTYEHEVLADETLADVAEDLAAQISEDGTDFTAATQKDTLLITSLAGDEFTTELEITPFGLPVEGDRWTITLVHTDASLAIEVDDDTVETTTTYEYVVQPGDSPYDVVRALAEEINTHGIPEFRATIEGNVLVIEDVAGNVFDTSIDIIHANGSEAGADVEVDRGTVKTRTEGINYYGIKIFNIDLGSADDVFNVQGTSAITNLNLGEGDERIYVSSTAAYDTNPASDTDFLLGHLHDVDGMLNIDVGTGRHKLMISDESSTVGDRDVLITDQFDRAAARPEAQHADTGEALLATEIYIYGLAQGAITYRADPAAHFAEGITIWTGFGDDDTIDIDGTFYRSGLTDSEGNTVRTITTLNTGLGDDALIVDLDAGEDGFFVLNTQGPYNDFLATEEESIALGASIIFSDADEVQGAGSTLPLIIFGGQDGDTIVSGSAEDIVFGDRGRVYYFDDSGELVTVFGQGGPGDITDGVAREPVRIFTVDAVIGGDDTVTANDGDDIVFGGINRDTIHGGEDNNIVFGDSGVIDYVMDDGERGDIDRIYSTDVDEGGNDIITTGDGDDIIIGGEDGEIVVNDQVISVANIGRRVETDAAAGDIIDAGNGDNLVFGDNGEITAAADPDDLGGTYSTQPITLGLVETVSPNIGGNDHITTGMGADIILGGVGNDTIIANDTETYERGNVATFDQNNIILGDNGFIDWTARDSGRDTIHGQTYDLHLGDDQDPRDIDRISTTDPTIGGSDDITSGAGNDLIFGGTAGDVIRAGAGNDLVFGDHGKTEAATTTTTVVLSGNLTTGDVWTVELREGDELVASYSYTVPDLDVVGHGNETLATIARALADAINTDELTPFIVDNQLLATTNGAELIIVSRWGRDFQTFFTNPTTGSTISVEAVPVQPGAVAADALPLSAAALQDPFVYLSIDTQNSDGGGDDLIYGEDGEDIILGQQGDDRIYGGNDADDLIGGHNVRRGHDGDDRIDGSDITAVVEPQTDHDVIIGDNGSILRRGDNLSVRVRVLNDGEVIYDGFDIAQVTGDPQLNPTGVQERDVVLFDHSFTPQPNTYGDDYIAGGPDDDVIFGQLGDDVIQGDGEVALTADPETDVSAQRVYIYTARASFAETEIDSFEYTYLASGMETRTATVTILTPGQFPDFDPVDTDDDVLVITADESGGYYPIYFTAADLLANDIEAVGGLESIIMLPDPVTGYTLGTLVAELRVITAEADLAEKSTDGDDYVEGNGGSDTVFGNLGQDDIIGGSSDLFGLNDRLLRPDGDDFLFGGAGTDIAHNDLGQAVMDEGEAARVIDTEWNGHSRDSDMILGDNGCILRLIEKNAEGQFLEFNYDQNPDNPDDFEQRGDLHIVVRAAELLDYTPGGLDYLPTATNAASDIGAADEIHGESGDDFIYGMAGSDVLFGDGQDDDLIGGYGNDWISGGTGQDGVLGDDGRIYTSRNSAEYGEPLFGIAPLDAVNVLITTPGKMQYSTINIEHILKKTVNLTPFKLGNEDTNYSHNGELYPIAADDIIYGGWGDDFLHGGDGDDAISGAEALEDFFDYPNNPGNVLLFSDPIHGRGGEFGAYNEYDPRRKILVDDTGVFTLDGTGSEFLLNFDQGEGPDDPHGSLYGYEPVPTDGDDVIFGDLGNDWLVGGTGKDHLYGGYGSDLMNVDDDHDSTVDTTDPRANDIPDTHPSYEDIAYGGAGRDVLIGNTGGDRLIDWAGEFNSYIVPFAPFGMAAVSRTLQPQLMEYLYNRSESDGADPTRGGDPARNGEPYGELGLVKQKDFDWHDQTGAPDDPQAGNIPGGKRDVLRSATFDGVHAAELYGFYVDSGVFTVEDSALRVTAESLGGDAVAVYHVDEVLPTYFEIQATITMEKPTGGWKANAYIIFDYYSPTDFKFAGLNASIDKIQMGHRDETGWHVDVQTNMKIKPGKFYNLLVAINGTAVTVLADNTEVFNHTFEPRIIDGWVYSINSGFVGFGSDNSRGVFDNITVQILPPEITYEGTEDFPDSEPGLDFVPFAGNWSVIESKGKEFRYEGLLTAGDRAVSLIDLGLDSGLEVASILELTTTLSTGSIGGFVFDFYDESHFKFAAIDADNDVAVIGHYTAKSGWVVDASFGFLFEPGQDYELMLSLKGSTVFLAAKKAGVQYWQAMVSHVFNAVTVDGDFGLLSKDDSSSFDLAGVKTNDPAFRDEGDNLLAAEAPAEPVEGEMLTEAQLVSIVEEAKNRWGESGLVDDEGAALLDTVSFAVVDLDGLALGYTSKNVVQIDTDAAGHGWFVDATPCDDAEFTLQPVGLTATSSGGAAGRMDLLTVVMHELGHVLGFDHTEQEGLMAETLEVGVRYLPVEFAHARTAAAVLGTSTGDQPTIADEIVEILHSAQPPPAQSGTVTFTTGQGSSNLCLRSTTDYPASIELFDARHEEVLAVWPVKNVTRIVITGSDDGNDWLTVDFSVPTGWRPDSLRQ
jgi:Ca2+-binding RTX toxin-like protein